MKVVVTGGAGFIGSHLVDALVGLGHFVHVVDTRMTEASQLSERHNKAAAYFCTADIRMTEKLVHIFSDVEVVFHLAAIPRVPYVEEHPVEAAQVNIGGTVSVLTAAALAGCRLVVHSSSGSVYGNQTEMPILEHATLHPVNEYGRQKLAAEEIVSLWPMIYNNLETVSLRYFNVYGPRIDTMSSYAGAVGAFLVAQREGKPCTIFGDGTITRDYTFVGDVVRANILAATSEAVGRGDVINIGAGKKRTIQSLAEMIGCEITYGPPRNEAHDSQADNRKAKELLGWEPTTTFEEGIEETKRWFSESH